MSVHRPAIRSFNGGEFSELMSGRTDLNRYGSSMKRLRNNVALPQGPAIRRSGTRFVTPQYDETKPCGELPFIFSDQQAMKLEFQSGRIRFISDSGLLARPPATAAVSLSGGFLRFDNSTLAAVTGEQLVLGDFPAAMNINSRVVKVTAVAGGNATTDFPLASLGAVTEAAAARVYHIAQPYSEDDVLNLRGVPLVDVIYILCDGYRARKLARHGTYDWRITTVDLIDGPYASPPSGVATTLTPDRTGTAVPKMTSDTTPSGAASGTTFTSGQSYRPFDGNRDTQWASEDPEVGRFTYQFATPTIIKGYQLYLSGSQAPYASGTFSRSPREHAPGTWTFEGSLDGTTWVALDTQYNYVLWDSNRSVYFEFQNEVAYTYYRFNAKSTRDSLNLTILVAELKMVAAGEQTIEFTANGTAGINNDEGFLSTDVGRALRVRTSDGLWTWFEIAAVTDATHITAKIRGGPLSDVTPIRTFRLGYFSDTTGWPTVGTIAQDRLWLAGAASFPDLIAGSVVGDRESFRPTDETGAVQDDLGLAFQLNAPRIAPIQWLRPQGKRRLIIGTGAGPWALEPADNQTYIAANNPGAYPCTSRGAAFAEPAQADNGMLYIGKTKGVLRECVFSYEVDNFVTPPMSIYASHLGSSDFEEIAFISEPHSVAMIRRADGLVAGFTYNREEDVLGWHLHDFGGFVERVMSLPSATGGYDTLWLTVRREVDGVTRRFHERLEPFWSFNSSLATAWYVDCGLRYEGEPTEILYGATHLDGAEVYGLADGSPIGPLLVENGAIVLPYEASNVVIGLPFDSTGETNNLEVQTATGTAQGKQKRVERARVRLWQSAGGWFGKGAVDEYPEETFALESRRPEDIVGQAVPLRTYDTEELVWPGDYTGDVTIVFKQPGSIPLPLNVIALLPQLRVNE